MGDPPPASCTGYYGITNAQWAWQPGAEIDPDTGDVTCRTTMTSGRYGYCMCSDGLPRFISDGCTAQGAGHHCGWSCDEYCAKLPGVPLQRNIPPIKPSGKGSDEYRRTVREMKLGIGAALVLLSLVLLVLSFAVAPERYDTKAQLYDLARQTNVAPTMRPMLQRSQARLVARDEATLPKPT